MASLALGVKFSPASSGTGDFVYSSTVTGYRSPTAALVNGKTYRYRAENATLTEWEFGYGVWNSSTSTLARTTVSFSSTGSKVSFTAAPVVGIVLYPDDVLQFDDTMSLTATQKAQGRTNVYAAPFDALAFNGLQINGGFEVSQENGASAIAIASGLQAVHLMDGWVFYKNSSSVLSAQQATSVFPGFAKELKLTVTTQAALASGSEYGFLTQIIEGYRFSRAGWGTADAVPITVSFWVKSNLTGLVPCSLYDAAGLVASSTNFTINAANTNQWVTLTFPAQTTGTWGTTNGVGGALRFWVMVYGGFNLGSSTSNTFETTGYFFAVGTETPSSDRAAMIARPYQHELRLCRRFFYKKSGTYNYFYGIGQAYTSAGMLAFIQLPEEMRAVTTFTCSAVADFQFYVSSTNTFSTLVQHGASTPEMVVLQCDGSGWGLTTGLMGALYGNSGGSTSWMKFDARLI